MLITARSVFAGVAELLLSLASLITTSNHWYTTSTATSSSASASRCANQADSGETGLHLLAIHSAASHGQQMI